MNSQAIAAAVLICAAGICTAQTSPAAVSSHSGTTSQSATSSAAAKKNTAAALPSAPKGEVVITIPNVCNSPTEKPCQTEVTKDEFEALYRTVAPPNAPPQAKAGIAEKYAQLLAVAGEARKEGIDKTPEYQEQLRITQLQILASALQKKVQTDAATVSDEDVKKYYDDNSNKYEEITVRRVVIPRSAEPKPALTSPGETKSDQQATLEDAQKLAETARQQLIAGTDPDKVEKDAYTAAKSPGVPPSTAAAPRRHGSFPPNDESKIFSLKEGEVSGPLQTGYGYEIYKVESKRQIPLDSVKDEIKKTLSAQQTNDRMRDILSSAKPVLNDSYFKADASPTGAPGNPALPAPAMPQGGAAPGSPSPSGAAPARGSSAGSSATNPR